MAGAAKYSKSIPNPQAKKRSVSELTAGNRLGPMRQ
jgi:hypothetical protein